MNQVEKPIKPRWFVIVEVLISFVLLFALMQAWGVLALFLQRVGIPPLLAMLAASVLLIIAERLLLSRWTIGGGE